MPLALAVRRAGAGLTVMLSGYASGGQLGLLLAAALFAAAAAGMLLPGPQPPAGVLGLGTVLLFGVVAIGYFFGELSLATVLPSVAPLAAWLVELPPLKKLLAVRRPRGASCWWAELWPWWQFVLGTQICHRHAIAGRPVRRR